jgi:hypothetical protein
MIELPLLLNQYIKLLPYPSATLTTHIFNFTQTQKQNPITIEIITAPMRHLSLSLFAQTRSAIPSPPPPPSRAIIHLWHNGISINDGSLLSFDDSVDPHLLPKCREEGNRMSFWPDGITFCDGPLFRFADPVHGVFLQALVPGLEEGMGKHDVCAHKRRFGEMSEEDELQIERPRAGWRWRGLSECGWRWIVG